MRGVAPGMRIVHASVTHFMGSKRFSLCTQGSVSRSLRERASALLALSLRARPYPGLYSFILFEDSIPFVCLRFGISQRHLENSEVQVSGNSSEDSIPLVCLRFGISQRHLENSEVQVSGNSSEDSIPLVCLRFSIAQKHFENGAVRVWGNSSVEVRDDAANSLRQRVSPGE